MSTTSPTYTRRFTRVLTTTFIAIGAVLGLSIAAATPALAHDQLVSYSAQDNDIRLSFNNEVLDVGAVILVTDASGADVADGEPEMSGNDVTQGVQEGLSDGQYTVDWRVVSSDGHPIQGVLSFDVADGEITTIEPVVTDEEAAHEEEHAEGDAGEHEHADEAHDHADEDEGPNALVVGVVALVAALVVAGVIAATVIGSRRRQQAIEDASRDSAPGEVADEPGEDSK